MTRAGYHMLAQTKKVVKSRNTVWNPPLPPSFPRSSCSIAPFPTAPVAVALGHAASDEEACVHVGRVCVELRSFVIDGISVPESLFL